MALDSCLYAVRVANFFWVHINKRPFLNLGLFSIPPGLSNYLDKPLLKLPLT
ncbi:hypothetical protein FIU95_10470 [Microbulbifer sp. THAF38]|nr:hypothetical protein FIU95_10470 [Microbulbifer sp. THAF38]